MFSIGTAPAKQKVSETISTLSARLGSATLLEDRRAAILGLRSFAKDYPASVASGGLRGLINSLSKDGEDVDTLKIVLETLLSLFEPNRESPEASEEIRLWLADEFTQRQENVSLLLDLVSSSDFYSKLYSLRLLGGILSARTERTEDCVLKAPLGIPSLVSTLEDRQDVLRNEALDLLISLTASSADIQKLVAFENAFERIFAIIAAEGSFLDGDRTVESCLILLANLLRWNIPNQRLFRESGFVPRLAGLLELAAGSQKQDVDAASWAQEQVNRNIFALLAVIRLFLVPGSSGTEQNQSSFYQNRLLYYALQLAFDHHAEVLIRSEALSACADMIRGNAGLQESFATLQVPAPFQSTAEDHTATGSGLAKVYVIDGLLDLTLSLPLPQRFDLRRSAYECLKAYFQNHPEIRLHFLRRAIDGHRAGVDETANVLTVLLRSTADTTDPYRIWFAAMITLHLLFENPTAKTLALGVTEGDASTGEEVVTSVQNVAANLVRGLKRDVDPRVLVAYLVLLASWLFEDPDAVNALLGEGSLIQDLSQPSSPNEVVQGLCALLLGIAYEFSTKDSPIPRSTLHTILASRLGRDRYLEKLGRLRSNPLMRDFEVGPQKWDLSGGMLPEVFFDQTFVDFFKDNYGRFVRAIDRDPGIEVSVVTNGVQKGISRELVDSLRARIDEQDKRIQTIEFESIALRRQLELEQMEHKKTRDTCVNDIAKMRSTTDGHQRRHEEELAKLQAELARRDDDHKRRLVDIQRHHADEIREMQQGFQLREAGQKKESEQMRKRAESETEKVQRRSDAEMADLRATISRLEVDSMRTNKIRAQELQSAKDGYAARAAEQAAVTAEAQRYAESLGRELKVMQKQVEDSNSVVAKAEKSRLAVQAELDDLLIVFGDLEEKVAKYKAHLRQLGEQVSDGEEEVEDDDTAEDSG